MIEKLKEWRIANLELEKSYRGATKSIPGDSKIVPEGSKILPGGSKILPWEEPLGASWGSLGSGRQEHVPSPNMYLAFGRLGCKGDRVGLAGSGYLPPQRKRKSKKLIREF